MIIKDAAVSMNSRRSYSKSAGFSLTQTRVRAFNENMAEAKAKAGDGDLRGFDGWGRQKDCCVDQLLFSGGYTRTGQSLYDMLDESDRLNPDAVQKMLDQAAGKTIPAAEESSTAVDSDPAAANDAGSVQQTSAVSGTLNLDDFSTRMKFSILQYILRLMFGQEVSPYGQTDLSGSTLGDKANNYLNSYAFDVTEAHYTYSEEESTSFATTGTVQTADGRDLSFNLNIAMTRSFTSSFDAVSARQAVLMDPLVIRTSEDVPADASISDQTFVFDIDGDGEEEEVQNLSAGYAFLALDQNENGKIDDGTELFGARSGNGFADLAKYDSDGNGWIDEADDIFSRLRVMTIEADGTQKLISLKDADIGAINLGSAPTEFTKTTDDGINVLGQMRRSGFFLHESTGSAGAMHQVDLGIRNPKSNDRNSLSNSSFISSTIEKSLSI